MQVMYEDTSDPNTRNKMYTSLLLSAVDDPIVAEWLAYLRNHAIETSSCYRLLSIPHYCLIKTAVVESGGVADPNTNSNPKVYFRGNYCRAILELYTRIMWSLKGTDISVVDIIKKDLEGLPTGIFESLTEVIAGKIFGYTFSNVDITSLDIHDIVW